MEDQKHLFQLEPGVHYLNNAFMAPLMKSVERAGKAGIEGLRNPFHLGPEEFFSDMEEVKRSFGKIINAAPGRIALIPSASYGLSAAVQNIDYRSGQHALTIQDEFPSGYFALDRWCRQHGATLKVIEPPESTGVKGREWNSRILEAISRDTACVLMSSVHWADGTRFDLKAIGERCHEVGCRFIVDGTQSVGAMPLDISSIHIDALVCAGYKWLMGPYSLGVAWYGPYFDQGSPLEETWMNRTNARQFSHLTQYDPQYKVEAGRFNVGESSNFILVPMLNAALEQLLDWGINEIQSYCRTVSDPLLRFMEVSGAEVEEAGYRAGHMFSLAMPGNIKPNDMMQNLRDNRIYVSLRGQSVRVSPHLYTTQADIRAVIDVLKKATG